MRELVENSEMTQCHDKHLLNEYISIMGLSGNLTAEFSHLLSILNQKRATLAEKAIKAKIHEFVQIVARLTLIINDHLKNEKEVLDISECLTIKEIFCQTTDELQSFFKAANHNLNYLEQYFEHDFWVKLEGNRFAEKICQIISRADQAYTKH